MAVAEEPDEPGGRLTGESLGGDLGRGDRVEAFPAHAKDLDVWSPGLSIRLPFLSSHQPSRRVTVLDLAMTWAVVSATDISRGIEPQPPPRNNEKSQIYTPENCCASGPAGELKLRRATGLRPLRSPRLEVSLAELGGEADPHVADAPGAG